MALRPSCAMWGDSLSAQSDVNDGYPGQFGIATGYPSYAGGIPGATSTQIKVAMLADTARYTNTVIIWAGRNNFDQSAIVQADIAAMVAALPHDNYLVLGILNSDTAYEYRNAAGWVLITDLNTALQTTYGLHYVPLREYLVSLYDPYVAADVVNHTNDVPPQSLRLANDSLHLNAAGNLAVAYRVLAAFAQLRGNLGGDLYPGLKSILNRGPAIGQITPAPGAFSIITSHTWNQVVGSSATADLLSIGSYEKVLTGILTIASKDVSGTRGTVKTFAVSIMGAGTVAGGVVQLSVENYSADTGAAFTISETNTAGTNKLSFVNGIAFQVTVTATLVVFQNDGTLTYL